jgi:hypothetical protein
MAGQAASSSEPDRGDHTHRSNDEKYDRPKTTREWHHYYFGKKGPPYDNTLYQYGHKTLDEWTRHFDESNARYMARWDRGYFKDDSGRNVLGRLYGPKTPAEEEAALQNEIDTFLFNKMLPKLRKDNPKNKHLP